MSNVAGSSGPVTYAADVGAVHKGAFAWARVSDDRRPVVGEGVEAMDGLVHALCADLEAGRRISLGWEAPLFVPVRDDPHELNRARGAFERTRAFSASGGTGALVTGLVELAHLGRRLPAPLRTLAASEVFAGVVNVWEAFVSGVGAPTPPCTPDVAHGVHGCDALVIAMAAHEVLSGRACPDWAQVHDATAVEWGTSVAAIDLVAVASGGVGLVSVDDVWDVRLVRTSKPAHRASAQADNRDGER